MADLTITVAQLLWVSGAKYPGIAGAAITAGKTCYLDSGTNTLKLADATGAAAVATVKGIALNAAEANQPLTVQQGGLITLGAGAAPTEGEIYVLSETAGGIAPEADVVTSDSYVTVLGVANDANQLVMNIHNSGEQIP